jgi:RNA polymerase sigma-70 factor (ECF subfamily)
MSEGDELIPTRRTLLSRLRNWDDHESWREFFDTYWQLIHRVARKAGLSEEEAQDVVQETVISIARKIPDFRYDPALGSFKAWLMQLTRWRIADHFRKGQYERNGKRYPREQAMDQNQLEQHADLGGFDLEAAWEEEWEKNLFETALGRVKARTPAKQFQLFYLHVVRGVPARDVARSLGRKLHEVYFAKYKLTKAVKQELRIIEGRNS